MAKMVKKLLVVSFVIVLSACSFFGGKGEKLPEIPANVENVALNKEVEASSVHSNYEAKYAVDGVYNTTESRWLTRLNAENPPHWLIIDLAGTFVLYKAEVWTGNMDSNNPDKPEMAKAAVENFKLQYLDNGDWVDIPGGEVQGNDKNNALVELRFKEPVTTEKVRWYSEDNDNTRVREIMIFGLPAEDDDES